jgi:hypothetical protein
MRKIVLSFLLAVSSISFGQTKDELDLCMAIQANSFTSNTEAENALDRILDVIGASKNFVLTPCDKISNAVATAYKGTRYILYDREFMNLISKNTNDWSNLFIFAHEVGHHINGHSIDLLLYTNDVVDSPSLEKSRKQELEADEFAAFVLAKLGANLSQLNNVITLISDNSDDSYSTHPKRDKRLASVRVGFNKGYIEPSRSNTNKNNSSKSTEKLSNIYSKWEREELNLFDYNKGKLESKYLKDPFFMKKVENNWASKVIWSKVKGQNIDPDWNSNYSVEYLVKKEKYLRDGGKWGLFNEENHWYRKGNYPFFIFELRIKIPDVNIEEFAIKTKFYNELINQFPFIDKIRAKVMIDSKLYLDEFEFAIEIAPKFETITNKFPWGFAIGMGKDKRIRAEIQDFCIQIWKSSDTYDFNNYKIDLNFISALKSGNKLFIELSPFTEKGLRIFNASQVFEFSLSGSSKALAD